MAAGTVTTARQAATLADAGAEFLVSPGITESVLSALVASGLPFMAGAMTPSEVMTALEYRAEFVKLFPAGALGVGGLRSLRDPFPDTPFLPTGGVTPTTVSDWLNEGAVALGIGGNLVPTDSLSRRDFGSISARAAQFVAARDAWQESLTANTA